MTELLPEGDLLHLLLTHNEDHRLSEVMVRPLFWQILHAVAYLHKQGVIHRDLKPENVLLRRDDTSNSYTIVLADFGFATFAAKEAAVEDEMGDDNEMDQIRKVLWLQSVVGTPSYMAPEILDARLGTPGYDHSADLWSCGVMLYIWSAFTLRIEITRTNSCE